MRNKALYLLAALALAGGIAFAQTDRQEPAEQTPRRPQSEAARESIPDRDSATRCEKLEGEGRSQCLRDHGAGAGTGELPKPAPPAAVQRDPVTEPPPQNPRQPR